ncbi:MAG: hypothetical protein VYC43_04920 [Pseudomonadota bacterium]|nr:hypothetical protein [Pseudomonadota bacterium]|tara:strand:+ start:498 stop:668 length:171 start_codon:yes stop_codon:yes gene_type:complete
MENEESQPEQPLFEIEETPFVPIEAPEIDYIGALEGFVLVILICMILLGIVQRMNK